VQTFLQAAFSRFIAPKSRKNKYLGTAGLVFGKTKNGTTMPLLQSKNRFFKALSIAEMFLAVFLKRYSFYGFSRSDKKYLDKKLGSCKNVFMEAGDNAP
jgi:hypothetical protein